jgi:hypothetical protein
VIDAEIKNPERITPRAANPSLLCPGKKSNCSEGSLDGSLFLGFDFKAFFRFRQRQAPSAQHDGSRCWSKRYPSGVTLNR